MKTGNLNIAIDTFVSCLYDNTKKVEVPTIVKRLYTAKELRGYNSKNGWYVNWQKLLSDNEVYALYVKGSNEIQGLAAIQHDMEASIVLLNWAVAAPHNNPELTKAKQYSGVGGHLFAIAVNRSFELGYDGVILGHPSDFQIMQHYIDVFHAEEFPFGTGYQYTIVLWEKAAMELKERYDYDEEQ